MRLIFVYLLFLFSNIVFANDAINPDVEVINLYETKSLDQMVLDNLNNENEIEELEEKLDVIEENDIDQAEVKQIKIIRDSFIYKNDIIIIKQFFENLQQINSQSLQTEIIKVLENIQLNLEIDKDQEIFFFIVNYLKSIGQINKSYEMIEKYELSNDNNYNFYTKIKFNYFLSTFQLNEACNFKDELVSDIKLDYHFLEKLDIFCLVLNDNLSEANLLNSILIESESSLDNYFQSLFTLISNSSDQTNIIDQFNINEVNNELIFLYSAMTRIAELPFSNDFYELDKKNLSIPIILNQASPIDLRIKAANESFLENLITVDSLSALYMSADFNSNQLNNPKETLASFSNNIELSMAFLFQLVNIQIFPNERLNTLIDFWNFAKNNDLEEIAYKLSINMLSSIETSSENIIYGPQIASAYIFNNDFNNAVNWIELYEQVKQVDSKSIYTRVLLDLYSSNDLDSFINSINLTLSNYTDDKDSLNIELLFVLKSVINLDIKANTNINLNKIFDDRSMPSILIFNEINNSILSKNDEKFLIYSLISLNGKEWKNIHPEHLKLILNGYLNYNDGKLFRNVILEILKNYKFLI